MRIESTPRHYPRRSAAVTSAVPATVSPSRARPMNDGMVSEVKGFFGGFGDRLSQLKERIVGVVDPFHRMTPERVDSPTQGSRLRVMSYNVMLGGKDYPGVLATIRKGNPDVVGLQEVSRETAERLAKDLGMHLAFYGVLKPSATRIDKAILSKHPIQHASHEKYDLSLGDHWDAMRRYRDANDKSLVDAVFRTELASRRGILEATFEAGGERFVMLDTHMTLKDSALNAAQLQELARRAKDYESKGYQVILVGDFNTNLALKTGPSTPGEGFADETDTLAEFKARYGNPIVGNIADPENMKAADALRSTLKSTWESTDRRFSITERDAELTPEEARTELATGRYKKGSAEWKELTAAADGITHLGAQKRFDNILVSEGLHVNEASIDLASKASDHQAIVAELSW